MNKNILLITSSHPKDDIRIYHKYAKYFADSFKSFLYVNGTNESTSFVNNNLTVTEFKFGFFNFYIPLFKKIFKFNKNDTVIHLHDPDLLILSILLALLGYKTVFDYHEDYIAQLYSKPYLNNIERFVLKLLLIFLVNVNDYLSSMTIFVTPDHLNKSISKNKLLVENYPIIKEKNVQNDKIKQFIYAGNISEHRGIYEMLDFIGLYNGEYKLCLAGKFRTNQLYDACQLHPNWKYVEFHGIVEREFLYELYNKSVAGLIFFHKLPNNMNSRPNKFYEYMEAGLPVICTDVPYWKEFVNKYNCGIPIKLDSFTEFFLESHDLTELGINGRNFIENDYNWQFMFSNIKCRFYNL